MIALARNVWIPACAGMTGGAGMAGYYRGFAAWTLLDAMCFVGQFKGF